MTTYFSSDWHLGHKRIIELCDRKFANVEEMNSTIIELMNDQVGPRDHLVVLGDTAMGSWVTSLEYLAQLRAKTVTFIPGNHCKWSQAYKHGGSTEAREAKREKFRAELEGLREGFRVFAEVPGVPSVWTWPQVATDEELGDHTHPLADVLFSHYPYAGESDHEREDRYLALRPVDVGAALVNGHVHEAWQKQGRQFNVGVDSNNFQAVSSDELIAWVESQA